MNNMEKKIAIRGHITRGAEVIKALEELGGSNSAKVRGHFCDAIYFIDNNKIHYKSDALIDTDKFQIYTLEEYLETLKQTEQMNDKTQRQLSVDIETAKQWYKTDNETLKQLALSLFTEEELTKKLPTSWEEFCEQNAEVDCEYYINTGSQISSCLGSFRDSKGDKNLLATQEDVEAISALIQLKRLRDAWWKILNYQPNWTDYEVKYCICICNDKITLTTRSISNVFLAFPTQESRNQFYTHFKDLILKAKPFLS